MDLDCTREAMMSKSSSEVGEFLDDDGVLSEIVERFEGKRTRPVFE